MSQRFTSGSVGRFNFATANRLSDAADKIESTEHAPITYKELSARRTIVARLTNSYANLQFSQEQNPHRTLLAWDWQEMSVFEDGGPLLRRSLTYVPGTMQASDYDAQTKGAAVCVDGDAASSDIVVLHPITNNYVYPGSESEVWWAFQGPRKFNTSVLLQISNAVSIGTRRWKYTVAPTFMDANGNLVADPHGYPAGTAYNTYEASTWGHGQQVTFSNPTGTLTVGAVSGLVLGTFLRRTGSSNDVGLYAFEAVNPMTPNC